MRIEAKYISQVYPNGSYGLDDFSVEIESGSFVTVLGESGCGKTTLLRVLSGLERYACGELYLDGVLSTDIKLKQRKTAMVFQEYLLYPKFTVWENVKTALERYDFDGAEVMRRVNKALRDFGLTDVASQLPRNLSGGQQQRVALAKAVVTDPELLLFDEPLSNVAEEQRAEYMSLISELKARLPQTTFVYVTHNVKEALTLGEKLLVMKDGKAVQYGDTAFVSRNPYSAEVLGVLYGTQAEGNRIYNPATKEYVELDADGECLSGQPRFLKLPASLNGRTLKLGGTQIETDEDYPFRFIGTGKDTYAYIPSDKISGSPFRGSEALEAVRDGDNYIVAGVKVRLCGIKDFCGKLYFPSDSVLLYENGVRALAHYRINDVNCYGAVRSGYLCLPCGKIAYRGKNGRVRVTLRGGNKAVTDKKGLKFTCLGEDDFGEFRMAYLRLKGFDNYVTLKTGKTYGKKRIKPDLFEAVVRYE